MRTNKLAWAGTAGALPGRVPGAGSARLPARRRLCTAMVRAGAVPAVMPFPGEKQHGVKSRVVAAAHGSRRDGTVPLGGESRGDASYPGRRHGLHAGSGRLGWKWALQCAGLLVPHSPWHWHGGCRLVGTWDGFSLDASQNQPSSSCSPNVLMLCIHLGTYLGPETWDLRVSWVTALSGDTAASPALQA